MTVTHIDMNVPDAIRDALTNVQRVYPAAFVGGGCLRDAYIDVRCRDIDIFVGPDFDIDTLRPILFTATISRHQPQKNNAGDEENALCLGQWDQYSDWFQSRVQAVWNIETIFMDPIQIIVMTGAVKPERHITRFDLGACQIGYDGKNVMVTDLFMSDVANRTFTPSISETDPRMEGTALRMARLQERFPDWTFALPSTFKEILHRRRVAAGLNIWKAAREEASTFGAANTIAVLEDAVQRARHHARVAEMKPHPMPLAA